MYRLNCDDVLAELDVAEDTGLTQAEVRARLAKHGPNQLRKQATRSAWMILISQFKGLVNVLLVAASILSFVLGDLTEGFAVLAVIAINAAIGFFTEIKATRSMEALYKMGSMSTRVRRNGRIDEIPAADLVPGDIVAVEGGDVITATDFFNLLRLAYSHINISGLLVNGNHHSAGLIIKAIFGISVTNIAHYFPHYSRNINITSGSNLSHDYHQTGGSGYFTGYSAIRVLSQNGVQNSIGYLVTKFIRVPFGN